jgi:uncharacterized protein
LDVASRTGRLLQRLAEIACARPLLTVALAFALAAVSLWYAFATLTFATSTRALMPRGLPFIERYGEYDRQFGQLDDVIVAVEAPSLPEAKVYANRLVKDLRATNAALARITYRIDPKQFEGRALLYLSTEKLTEIRDRIFDYQKFLEASAARPTLDQLVDGLGTQVASGFAGAFLDLGLDTGAKSRHDLSFIEDLVTQMSARLDRTLPYRSPFGSLFSVSGGDEGGYFLSDDQKILFILAEAISKDKSFTDNREAIEDIRGVIARLRRDFPEVRVGVTGKPALSNDEMVTAFRDSESATLLAFALTLGLLLVAFLRVGKPLVMLVLLAVSLSWAMGVATLGVGHLSLFSVMFVSIVIGLGIDYGIYFLFRYEEELFLGRGLTEAIGITAARSGHGMLLGAVTAAGTFYVLMLTDFRGLQELGFIAGSAILLAWLAMMTVFPAALVLIDRRHAGRLETKIPRALALERIHVPLVERLVRYPKTVLALATVVTLVSAWGLKHVRFDYNLLNLQARGTESVLWEKRILAAAHRSGFVALASADSLEELRRKHDAFAALPTVSEVDSALLLIPPDQAAKQKIISDFAAIVAPVRVARLLPLDLDHLTSALATLRRRINIAATEAPPGEAKRKVSAVAAEIERLLAKLQRTDRETSEASLSLLQYQLYRDFLRSFQRLQANLNPRPVGLADVPDEIRHKFISLDNRFLLQIHPAVNIWDRDGATQFVRDLRAVDPEVTGTPIITFEAIRLMERGALQGTLYAILLVSIITAIMLRRIRETLLALLPLGLGVSWTVGLMYFLNLKFTLGNIFALPLILGAAAEYGLNVVLRFMEGQDHGGPLIARSTVMGVLVSGLSNIVGFGSLMMADHRGIFGLGLLLTLAAAASLVAALIVLPVLLRMVEQMRAARRLRRAIERTEPVETR